jgi:hypothetical protein
MSHQLVLFDLNGVLGRKVSAHDASFQLEAQSGHVIQCRSVSFVARPGAVDLIRALLLHGIDVGLWSTMREETVIEIGRKLLGDFMFDKLLLRKGSMDPSSIKLLSTLPMTIQSTYGSSIVILDDTPDKINRNPEGSWIVVSPFDGDAQSADLTWMYEAVRDISNAGIRVPRSMTDRSQLFFSLQKIVRAKYPLHDDRQHQPTAAEKADAFMKSVLM